MKKSFLITTGGSGGHVIPATILYEHLAKEANVVISIDKRGLSYLNKDYYKFKIINTPKLNNIFLLPFNLIIILFLTIKSFFLLKSKRIEKLFSTGGYMSLPLILAAKLHGFDSLDHIVCFDMAQLQGNERVGAAVVLRNGRPAKKEYRTYRIKTEAVDDLRMMQEVVQRWLKRQEEWPDLLLLDGGKVHLSHVNSTLEENGVSGRFPVAALAKKEETLWRLDAEPVVLDRRSRVLIHARDEAHRFVNTYHRKRRSKGGLKSPLEEVEGLGAKKIQSLLRHFGGMKGIEHATIAELALAPGIGKSLAARIYEHLH